MTALGTKWLTLLNLDDLKTGPSLSSKPNDKGPRRAAKGVRMSEDSPFHLDDTFKHSFNEYLLSTYCWAKVTISLGHGYMLLL